jgi:pseudaminic acid synthase
MIIDGNTPWIIAEIGAAHDGLMSRAEALVRHAAMCGADAVKFQCFSADTMTIDCDRPEFTIQDGPWKGMKLYDLYAKAAMPWDWFPDLFALARKLNITPFASVFDKSSVDFLETLGCPVYKIASFECNDTPLIEYTASKGKPIIISTGMASSEEIWKAYCSSCYHGPLGDADIHMLHCVSSYPCPPEEAGLLALEGEDAIYDGLSDHTIGSEAAIIATVFGVKIIEKHITLNRRDGGLDDGFASEPHEFAAMVKSVRSAKAMLTKRDARSENPHKPLRRSLYVVKDVSAGEMFTEENVRSIRPANGCSPREIYSIIGKTANQDVNFGTPMSLDFIQ